MRFTNYDGVKFHHDPFDTHGYDRLSFYVYGGEKGGQPLQVGTMLNGKATDKGITLKALPAGHWVAVTVPLENIGLKDKPNLSDFWIQSASAATLAPVYIDDVRLLKPTDAAPTGETLAL